MIDSVRARLTLWHAGVFAVLMASFGIGVYLFLRAHFFERADGILRSLGSATISILADKLNESGNEEAAAKKAVAILGFPKHSITIFNEQGRIIADKPAGVSAQLPVPALDLPLDRKFHMFSERTLDAEREFLRVAVQRARVEPSGKTYTVMTSRSMTPILGELNTDGLVLGVAIPSAVLVAGLAGWFLSKKSLTPVMKMADQARRIGAENLDQRLRADNPRDELGQLAATFNELLSRLNSAFVQRRQFMAEAAHELRTPISVIRTAAAVTLEKGHRGEDEYRNALQIMEEQSRRLSRIVEDLFRLARADAGQLTLNKQTLYLDELMHETERASAVLTSRKNIAISFAPCHEIVCHGDEDLLRRMMLNLVENAVKYTPEGGRIGVELKEEEDRLSIRVADSGLGIPAEAQPHIFERFYRAENVMPPGSGLGLAIARSIAEAHGGSLSLLHSDENGSTFEAVLPISRTTAA